MFVLPGLFPLRLKKNLFYNGVLAKTAKSFT